jgi:hypothetical protein
MRTAVDANRRDPQSRDLALAFGRRVPIPLIIDGFDCQDGALGRGRRHRRRRALHCSRAADYVHGAVLSVDGGWLAR